MNSFGNYEIFLLSKRRLNQTQNTLSAVKHVLRNSVANHNVGKSII